MMAYLNHVSLFGHVGMDPEVRVVGPNRSVAKFRVASTKRTKKADGSRHERTTWITVVAWGVQAEFVRNHVRKGHPVLVVGELETREWDDKNGGGKRHATEVIASSVQSLLQRERSPGNMTDEEYPEPPPPSSDDELPF